MNKCPKCGYVDGLTVGDAAERLGVTGEAIRQWIGADRIAGAHQESVPGGWRWIIPLAEVERLEAERGARPAAVVG